MPPDPQREWAQARKTQKNKDTYTRGFHSQFSVQVKAELQAAFEAAGFPSVVAVICTDYSSSPHVFSLSPNPTLTFVQASGRRGNSGGKLAFLKPMPAPVPLHRPAPSGSIPAPPGPPPSRSEGPFFLISEYAPFTVHSPFGPSFQVQQGWFDNSQWNVGRLKSFIRKYYSPDSSQRSRVCPSPDSRFSRFRPPRPPRIVEDIGDAQLLPDPYYGGVEGGLEEGKRQEEEGFLTEEQIDGLFSGMKELVIT